MGVILFPFVSNSFCVFLKAPGASFPCMKAQLGLNSLTSVERLVIR